MPISSFKQPRSATFRSALALGIAGIATASLPAMSNAGETTVTVPAANAAGLAFDRLKTLEGNWRVADREGRPLRIKFYQTAGGNTLVESWEANDRSHSLTIYHRDGDALLATHYCPQGNQPRMALVQDSDGQISFKFRDVTDLNAEQEQHQHDLVFNITGGDRIIRSEKYLDGDGNMHPSQLVLERVSGG